MHGSSSRIQELESVAAAQATRIAELEQTTGSQREQANLVTKLETLMASQAQRLQELEVRWQKQAAAPHDEVAGEPLQNSAVSRAGDAKDQAEQSRVPTSKCGKEKS